MTLLLTTYRDKFLIASIFN